MVHWLESCHFLSPILILLEKLCYISHAGFGLEYTLHWIINYP